jgi:hypothetical protein
MRPPFPHHHEHAAVAGLLIPLVTTGRNNWRQPEKVIDVDQPCTQKLYGTRGVRKMIATILSRLRGDVELGKSGSSRSCALERA